MRNKMIFSLVIVGVLTILVSYALLFQPQEVMDPATGFPTGVKESIFTKLKSSYDAYIKVQKVDYESQRLESERLKSQLQFVDSEIKELEASLINIEAERAEKELLLRQEKTEEINQKAADFQAKKAELEYQIALKGEEGKPVVKPDDNYLDSTSDLIYSLLLDGVDGTTTAIATFIGDKSGEGYYTVKLVGYLDSLTESLDNITANMEGYDISIGHCSLRQIYSCYDNMRPWDRATLLKWFNNNYVTGSGQVGSVTGGYIMDTIATNGILGAETVESLTREKDRDLMKIRDFYQDRIDELEAERINEIVAAYRYPDQTKVNALLDEINGYYDAKIAEENAKCEAEEAAVIAIFNARVNAIGNTTSEDTQITHPELLIYTLDITFSVHND